MSRSMQLCHGIFIDRFIFKSNLLWMRLPWECHNQSQDTNWRHCVTGPQLPFFHKRKGVLKIDQSVKIPWHRLSMGVASSCSSAPDKRQNFSWQSYDSFKDEIETCNDCIFRPILKGSWFYSLLVTPDENDSCCFWGRKPTPWDFQGFFFSVRSKTSPAFTKLDTTTAYSPPAFGNILFDSRKNRVL